MNKVRVAIVLGIASLVMGTGMASALASTGKPGPTIGKANINPPPIEKLIPSPHALVIKPITDPPPAKGAPVGLPVFKQYEEVDYWKTTFPVDQTPTPSTIPWPQSYIGTALPDCAPVAYWSQWDHYVISSLAVQNKLLGFHAHGLPKYGDSKFVIAYGFKLVPACVIDTPSPSPSDTPTNTPSPSPSESTSTSNSPSPSDSPSAPVSSSSSTSVIPAPTVSTSTKLVVSYPNCAAVIAAHKAPLLKGQPGYSLKLDSNHNGVACETVNKLVVAPITGSSSNASVPPIQPATQLASTGVKTSQIGAVGAILVLVPASLLYVFRRKIWPGRTH